MSKLSPKNETAEATTFSSFSQRERAYEQNYTVRFLNCNNGKNPWYLCSSCCEVLFLTSGNIAKTIAGVRTAGLPGASEISSSCLEKNEQKRSHIVYHNIHGK